jgi:hypothetical protein
MSDLIKVFNSGRRRITAEKHLKKKKTEKCPHNLERINNNIASLLYRHRKSDNNKKIQQELIDEYLKNQALKAQFEENKQKLRKLKQMVKDFISKKSYGREDNLGKVKFEILNEKRE